MKKRLISILLLCCMVLTLLPTTVLAADGPMDTIPKYDVSIDVYNRTSDISIKDSRSYYIYSSVPDKLRDTWAWDKKIFIKGDKTAPHVFIDGVNIEMSPSSKGPAIELNKKASAYIYFIGRDSTLQGATGRAAIQKNRSEGQVHVLVRTGTTVTCKGGEKAAGIGGSYATRNIFNGYYNGDMYGHGVNMHFGSRSNPDYWGGTIAAIGGNGGAGIGGGLLGKGKDITVSGDAKLKVQGGVEDGFDGAGAGIGDGGRNAYGSPIPGAEVEPDTSGLTTAGRIEYYAPGADMENDKPTSITFGTSSQPEKPIEPAVPEQPEAERGMDAPLYRVTDKDGRDIVYTAERKDGVLTVNVDEDFAILTGRLSGIRTLKAQGVEKIIFVTKGAASVFLLSDLLEKGESGDTYKLTHDGKAVTFTLGEKMTDVSAILTKP